MAKLRRTIRDPKAIDRRQLALQLAHALGIHAPVTGLAVQGQAVSVRWCLLCGRQ